MNSALKRAPGTGCEVRQARKPCARIRTNGRSGPARGRRCGREPAIGGQQANRDQSPAGWLAEIRLGKIGLAEIRPGKLSR